MKITLSPGRLSLYVFVRGVVTEYALLAKWHPEQFTMLRRSTFCRPAEVCLKPLTAHPLFCG